MQEETLLSELRDEDESPLFELINDPGAIANNLSSRVDRETHREWFKTIRQDEPRTAFAVIAPPDRQLVGSISVENIHPVHRNAEVFINLSARAQDQELGTRAFSEAAQFCWRELDLYRLYLHALSTNQRAIHLCEAAGFEIEGTLQAHAYFNDQYHDCEILGLLRPSG